MPSALRSVTRKSSSGKGAVGETIAMDETRVEQIARIIYANVHHLMRVTGTEAQSAYEAAAKSIIAKARPTDPGEDKVEAVAKLLWNRLARGHDFAEFTDAARATIAAMGHTPPSGEERELAI